MLFVLVSANVYVSSSLSTAGEELKDIELETRVLVEQNQDLRNQILQNSSLQTLQERANSLGYVRIQDVVGLDHTSETVAMTP